MHKRFVACMLINRLEKLFCFKDNSIFECFYRSCEILRKVNANRRKWNLMKQKVKLSL